MPACLTLVPEAQVGDWVLVHAGFAIQMLDEQDALETWKYLKIANLGESPAHPDAG
jgi:hydrogenase expression/formation protein HypC